MPPNQYFVRRKVTRDCKDYWAARRDPDGVLRDRMAAEEEQQHLDDIAEELAFVRGVRPASILDVGCGPGWFLSAIDAETKVGTEMCRIATTEASRRGVVVHEDMASLADGSFDVVRCHHVIEHIPEPEDSLIEMHRVCRKWLIMSTPDFGSPCAVRFGDRYRMLHDDTHCSLFTNESMHRFLRDNGFVIQQVTYPFPSRYAAGMAHRWLDTSAVSPAWPGNWMTFYCTVDKC